MAGLASTGRSRPANVRPDAAPVSPNHPQPRAFYLTPEEPHPAAVSPPSTRLLVLVQGRRPSNSPIGRIATVSPQRPTTAAFVRTGACGWLQHSRAGSRRSSACSLRLEREASGARVWRGLADGVSDRGGGDGRGGGAEHGQRPGGGWSGRGGRSGSGRQAERDVTVVRGEGRVDCPGDPSA